MSEIYRRKVILAPMVRICTLPMRLLALDYGADLVYCEEIIDRKILLTQRKENTVLGTTDFVLSDGTIVFRTCPQEKEKVIFQLGTCDAKRALAAAHKVQKDVAGIDINMGCPKEFSVKGGMGCALLTQPEKVKQILKTLVEGLSIPVTCKIRVLPKLEDTLQLAKLIESTGVAALAIHGRTKDERPHHPNRNSVIRSVAEALSIPVIANGGSNEILQHEDIEKFRDLCTGASSVMLARVAEWNCSIFRPAEILPLVDVVKSYLTYAFQYDNNEINTKYCILQMLHETMETPEGQAMLSVKSMEEISQIWGMTDQYRQTLQDRREREHALCKHFVKDECGFKRRKADDGRVVFELPVRFDRKCYQAANSPKQCLHEWCKKCGIQNPVYQTEEHPGDRSFHCRVLVDGRWFTTSHWEKKKQVAQQGAAMSFLLLHGVHDGHIKEPEDQTPELRQRWLRMAKLEGFCNASQTICPSKNKVEDQAVDGKESRTNASQNDSSQRIDTVELKINTLSQSETCCVDESLSNSTSQNGNCIDSCAVNENHGYLSATQFERENCDMIQHCNSEQIIS